MLTKKRQVELADVHGNAYAKRILTLSFFVSRQQMRRFEAHVRTWKRLLFYGVS